MESDFSLLLLNFWKSFSVVAFNHYAKIKRILAEEPNDWYILRINKPTSALNFKNEKVHYDHYYRIYRADGAEIKFCKFQKIDKLASILDRPVETLPIIESS